jgi:hypothetical protein
VFGNVAFPTSLAALSFDFSVAELDQTPVPYLEETSASSGNSFIPLQGSGQVTVAFNHSASEPRTLPITAAALAAAILFVRRRTALPRW